MAGARRINRVHRSLPRPLTILGAERKLFFFAMCLGAATFNLLNSLVGGLMMFLLLYFLARWATETDPQILPFLLPAPRLRAQYDPMKFTPISIRASVAPRFPPAPRSRQGFSGEPNGTQGIHDDRQPTAVHHRHLAGLRILAPRPVEVHGPLQAGAVPRLRNNDSDLHSGSFCKSIWCGGRNRPPLLPEEYRAQTLAPRQAVQRHPSGNPYCRERGGFKLMPRDAFSYDPQDAGETRDTSTRHSSRQQKSAPPDTRYSRNPAPEAPGRGDGSEVREQRPTRDERSDSPRPYYVRDRAYLLRDSEMNSLKEIGKFRVIPVSDLAKYLRRKSPTHGKGHS